MENDASKARKCQQWLLRLWWAEGRPMDTLYQDQPWERLAKEEEAEKEGSKNGLQEQLDLNVSNI